MSTVVAQNLVHQQLWSSVSEFGAEAFAFCAGIPPKALHPDDETVGCEYVLVSRTKDQWTVAEWAGAFKALREHEKLKEEPRRLVMALITDDSTVVYYLVHNGLVKPRKN